MTKREIPPITNLVRAMLALRQKSGRELAIVGASWIDVILEQNLRANMQGDLTETERERLFDYVGPLSTTSAKIDVARSFGLISAQTRAQSHLVNKVRNAFAHTIDDLDSDSPSIGKLIAQMNHVPDDALKYLTIDRTKNDAIPSTAFLFDGELFDESGTSGIFDINPERLLFFLPSVVVITNDDRLLQQIYACVIGAAGLGLKNWIVSSAPPGGIAEMVS